MNDCKQCGLPVDYGTKPKEPDIDDVERCYGHSADEVVRRSGNIPGLSSQAAGRWFAQELANIDKPENG